MVVFPEPDGAENTMSLPVFVVSWFVTNLFFYWFGFRRFLFGVAWVDFFGKPQQANKVN
jgi:hypothetical protein